MRVFIINEYWILSNAFFVPIDMIMGFFLWPVDVIDYTK